MGNQKSSKTITVESGKTTAIDLRGAIFPLGYTVRIPSGSTANRKFSNGNKPGNKYVVPPQRGNNQTQTYVGAETTPFGWLQIGASGGPVHIDFVGSAPGDFPVFESDDAVAAKQSTVAESVAENDTIIRYARDYFTYQNAAGNGQEGTLDLTVSSATPAEVQVAFDHDTGEIHINGAGTTTSAVAVTITATDPCENTAAVTVNVSVV